MIKSNCVFDESNCVFDESNLFQKNEKNSIVISFFVGEIKQCWDCCVSRISFFFFWYFWEWFVHERLRLKFFFWLINRVLKTQFSSGRHVENMPNQM